ncbi:MAG TPA: DUF2147 domain-containing protein [Xanthomonadales bacterium]|nr:DUF2147 domain-containing protein [Xanthomonadales bacterium]
MKTANRRFRSQIRAIIFGIFFACFSALAAEPGLDGNWQTGEDNTVVSVSAQDGVYTGKLVSSDNPKAKVGTEILRNVSLVDGVWKGSLYAPKRDKVMDAVITPATDELSIKVSAGLVRKTVTWTRAAE